MTDLEIPFEKDRHGHYRFFEILPGALSYFMLALPIILSLINTTVAAIFAILYLLIIFTRGISGVVRSLHGYHVMRVHQKLPWSDMLAELEKGEVSPLAKRPKWHRAEVVRSKGERPLLMRPSQVVHAVIVTVYKESREVVQPTIESILASKFNMKNVLLILAYEERGGKDTAQMAASLRKAYKKQFKDVLAIKHPSGIKGEIIGKGGNINYAGHKLVDYARKKKIDPLRIMVTTLDADNRPDPNYLNALTYAYVAAPNPIHASYQPVSLYTNNIWDAPALTRVVAVGNSFFNIVTSLRTHALRNFSSHSQPLSGLQQTNFWSGRTVVEDGHQFWRSYFAFDGNYRVLPLHVPIYQDAVMSDSLLKTLKAQFIQLRRWTYGASDVAYVAEMGFYRKNNISRFDLFTKFWRLLEGHITWAIGPILSVVIGSIPAFFNHQSFTANELPLVASRMGQIGVVIGVLALVFTGFRTLPKKPARYKHHRTILMVLQWVYLPITTWLYNPLAAFNSQTRLIFKWYLTKFDVTEKAVVVETAGRRSGLKS